MVTRSIVHLDADAFFASVEQSADARLRGKAIAVGGEKRGIIASASYEARRMGVYTPMPTVQARKLCPHLIVLPGDYERYEQFSRWMFAYAFDFTPEVEVSGIDEGYYELSGSRKNPREVADVVQRAIRQTLKISVSEGMGTSKLVSQIASKLRKPAALIEVAPGGEREFLHPLPNKWLPGIGPKTAARLDAAGLRQIRQIAETPPEMLEILLGNGAACLSQYARGIDDRPLVVMKTEAKSYGEQETFAVDLTDEDFIEAVLRRMADKLMAKVRTDGKCIRTISVKVRYNDMAEDQRSESLPEPTDLESDIYGRLRVLLRLAWKRRVSLRLVALKLSNIYTGWRQTLLPLGDAVENPQARRHLALTVDALRRSHGAGVILRGHDLRLREGPRHEGAPTAAPTEPSREKKTTPLAAKASRAVVVPLNVRSYYSFLDSTLSPGDVVALALRHELPAVALTDTGSLHGAPELARRAQAAGLKPIFGAELRVVGGGTLLLYVKSKQGWENLCQLLTNHARAAMQQGGPEEAIAALHRRPMARQLLDGLTEGLLAVSADASWAGVFPGHFYHAVTQPGMDTHGLPGVVCPRIHYEAPADRLKWDILQSIRTGTLLRQRHVDKKMQGTYHFRTSEELAAVFKDEPRVLAHTVELAERCEFIFPFGPPQFPHWVPPDGSSPRAYLRQLVMEGLRWRYGEQGLRYVAQAEEELSIIAEVGYEEYFLIVWDLLQECQRRGIDWITRGSAADSLVCYCLGISGVCPVRFELYFRRFLNKDRMALQKLPDIDVDFPHDRKDDVVDILFTKYGPEHCAAVGGFNTLQARGAFGEVAKVLGVSEYQVRRFTERFPWSGAADLMETLQESLECRDLPLHEEPWRTAITMAGFLDGFPRYPKMHPCGIVLSRERMTALTPLFISGKGWATAQFDMDAAEEVGLIKMDILAQGGLAVMRDACAALAAHGVATDLAGLAPWEDAAVWEMIAAGEARAVHHIESPAMISLCRMTNVREIDGLIAIVSVIRPGAANESKKLRFTRRYQGLEPVTYPHECLEACLRSTYGLVVYEEHILQICECFAGLTGGRADVLRRALTKHKAAVIEEVGREFAISARARGHGDALIEEVWQLVTGFNGYAFNKAHSTAYGVEAYQAAWLKRYHPAEFMAGVLTNGKGFYAPLVYVLECHRLGITLLLPDVNAPGPGFVVVEAGKIRVPVSAIKGLSTQLIERLPAHTPYTSLREFCERLRPLPEDVERLIRAGALDSLGLSRTRLFWEAQVWTRHIAKTSGAQDWLLPPPTLEALDAVALVEPSHSSQLATEHELFGYVVSGHPLDLYDHIAWSTYCPVERLRDYLGQQVVMCGLIIEQRTHHQVTGEPMKFLTLCDPTGMVETELFAQTYKYHALATVRYPVLEITATVEPFENGKGFSLRVHHAGKPREVS